MRVGAIPRAVGRGHRRRRSGRLRIQDRPDRRPDVRRAGRDGRLVVLCPRQRDQRRPADLALHRADRHVSGRIRRIHLPGLRRLRNRRRVLQRRRNRARQRLPDLRYRRFDDGLGIQQRRFLRRQRSVLRRRGSLRPGLLRPHQRALRRQRRLLRRRRILRRGQRPMPFLRRSLHG